MLQAYYGSDDNCQSFELSYPVAPSTAFGALPPGVAPTRSFASIAQAEQEGNDARVFGGLHYRSSVNVADIEGRTIAACRQAGPRVPNWLARPLAFLVGLAALALAVGLWGQA